MMRRVVLALLAVAVLAPAAHAATTTRGLPGTFTPKTGPASLDEKRVTAIFLRHDKVADWLDRYEKKDLVTDATFDKARRDYARRYRGFEAWQAVIRATEAAVDLPFDAGMKRER